MHRSSMLRTVAVLVIVLGLLAAACAGAGDSSSDADSGSADSTPTTTAGSDSSSELDGPLAPDFTLALGEDGAGSFTLSEGAMPVYMVFWAEW